MIFYGHLIENEPPLFLGLMWIILFILVKQQLEKDFVKHIPVTIDNEVNYFELLYQKANLSSKPINILKSPYCNGYPINSIPHEE